MTPKQHDLASEQIIAFFTIIIVAVVIIALATWCKRTFENILNPLDRQYYSIKWNRIQQLSGINDTRPLAIIHANSLLDDALKKRKYSGVTMNERLVSAQSVLTNKDQVWFAHRLRNQVTHDADMMPLPEQDMRRALQGFRQALADSGALQ